MKRLATPWIFCVLVGCAGHELAARWNELRGDPYPLDNVSRELVPGNAAVCPELTFTRYAGEHVPYSRPALVEQAFIAKLKRFEAVAVELGHTFYRRAPTLLRHYGVRVCRTVRGNSTRLSEHALGNAIDVVGFHFPRLTQQQRTTENVEPPRTAEGLPRRLHSAFEVNVREHWGGGRQPIEQRHQRFLRALVDRVTEDNIFRGVIGPGREGHADHLHFDQSPWGYVLLR